MTYIADTILDQLGGPRFIAMTGANSFVADHQSLKFKLPRNGSKANVCKITLMPGDLYMIEFIKFSPSRFYKKTFTYTEPKWETVQTYRNVYANQLVVLFEQYTKLYTRL